MRFFFILIFIFNFTIMLYADWNWVSGGSFNDIEVVSSSDIWFGGELLVHGIKGSDGTWQWSQQGKEITDNKTILKIDFYDHSHGMILSSNYIFYTDNGGSSWDKFKIPNEYSINNIYMVGEKSAYACGSENSRDGQGIILKTTDNGKTWTLLYKTSIYYGGSFTQIKMFSSTDGIAIGTFYDGWGSFGALFKTTNDWITAGKSLESSENNLWGFSAPTEKDIYVRGGNVSSNPYISYSHNGSNWITVKLDSDIVRIDGLAFDNATHGYAVGHYDNESDQLYREYGGVLLETNDSGKTWKRTNFKSGYTLTEEKNKNLTDVVTLNLIATTGKDVFIGQKYSETYPCADKICTGKILYKKNGETEWQFVNKLSGYRYTKTRIFDTGTGVKALLAGYDILPNQSFIIELQDNNIKTPHFFEYTCSFSDFDMIDQSEGWGAYCRDSSYQKLYILHTTDGGASWSKNLINFNDTFIQNASIKVNSNNHIILSAKSSENYILKNLFGNTEKFTIYNLMSLNYLDNDNICMVDSYSPLCIDSSNNKKYLTIGSDQYAQFLFLQFENNNVGFAVRKSDKAIFKTVDNGNSWLLSGKADFSNSTNFKIKFVDNINGYIIDGNTLKFTYDAGATWQAISDGVNPDKISGFDFTKTLKGIIYTPSGMILENTEGEKTYTKNYYGTFDDITYDLYVPCITLGNNLYIAMFYLKFFSPVVIELKDIGLLPFADNIGQCATFDSNTNIFNIPYLKVDNKFYSIDFKIKNTNPVQLELVNIKSN